MDNPYQPPSTGEPPPPPLPRREIGLKDPRLLGLASLVFYAISLSGEVIEHFGRTFAAGVPLPGEGHLHDTYYIVAEGLRPLEWLMLGAMLPSVILYFLWKYRVARNAWILDPGTMKITPAMAVGSYFIPLVHFVLPCRAMAEIARASYGSTTGVAIWWTTQLVAMVASLALGFTAGPEGFAARPTLAEHLYLAWSIFTFVCAWQIVMRITRAQSARAAA